MVLVFFLFWMLLNGQWTTELVLIGLVLSLLAYLFVWKFMGYSPKREWAFFKRLPKALGYLVYLIGEIIKSSRVTIRLIWSPSLEVDPQLVSFRTKLKTGVGRVLLCDSITMTPGTVTVDLEGDKVLVHALDATLAEGLEDSDMEKRIVRLEGKKHHKQGGKKHG